jgi:hypothetical protein
MELLLDQQLVPSWLLFEQAMHHSPEHRRLIVTQMHMKSNTKQKPNAMKKLPFSQMHHHLS